MDSDLWFILRQEALLVCSYRLVAAQVLVYAAASREALERRRVCPAVATPAPDCLASNRASG